MTPGPHCLSFILHSQLVVLHPFLQVHPLVKSQLSIGLYFELVEPPRHLYSHHQPSSNHSLVVMAVKYRCFLHRRSATVKWIDGTRTSLLSIVLPTIIQIVFNHNSWFSLRGKVVSKELYNWNIQWNIDVFLRGALPQCTNPAKPKPVLPQWSD